MKASAASALVPWIIEIAKLPEKNTGKMDRVEKSRLVVKSKQFGSGVQSADLDFRQHPSPKYLNYPWHYPGLVWW